MPRGGKCGSRAVRIARAFPSHARAAPLWRLATGNCCKQFGLNTGNDFQAALPCTASMPCGLLTKEFRIIITRIRNDQ